MTTWLSHKLYCLPIPPWSPHCCHKYYRWPLALEPEWARTCPIFPKPGCIRVDGDVRVGLFCWKQEATPVPPGGKQWPPLEVGAELCIEAKVVVRLLSHHGQISHPAQEEAAEPYHCSCMLQSSNQRQKLSLGTDFSVSPLHNQLLHSGQLVGRNVMVIARPSSFSGTIGTARAPQVAQAISMATAGALGGSTKRKSSR